MYASVPMIELGNPPPNPPEVWNVTGIATGDFTTKSPARIGRREIPIVASSISGPATGTTLAARIAKYCGSPPCACAGGAAQSAVKPTAETHHRVILERMQNSSRRL